MGLAIPRIELPGKARFRVNIFSQQGNYSAVLRKLEARIPTISEMNLPEAFHQIAQEKNGIILVTGATGSGKSTSLAAMLNEINEHMSVHIVTLEDPVEFAHPHKMATFNQREMGNDFDTFANGLRAALRQAPKVILVGEMRDRETVEIGLSAAETGHLVLSTLHTVDAGQTINRILGMFSTEEENQIRIRLADTVRWIVCQRLLPKEGGGRVAAFEILGSNLRVKDTILNGESEGKTFYEIIEAGKAFGMITFDDYIIELFRQGLITEETAKAYASNRGIVGRGIDSIKSSMGQATTDIGKLEVDKNYRETGAEILTAPPEPMHRDCKSVLYDFSRIVNSQEREQVMEEKKSILQEVASDYDAADRLFDFVEEKSTTALVCEPDPVIREKISESLKELGYKIMTATTAKDALKALWFFVFDVVVINELFDAADPQADSVLNYLQEMPMATRRRSFVALLNARFRTLDNMAAFNRSVNIGHQS